MRPKLDWILNAALANSDGAAASEAAKQTVDFIGHVANGDHPLIHLPPIFGIDFSVTKHVFMVWLVAAVVFVVVTSLVRRYLRQTACPPAA